MALGIYRLEDLLDEPAIASLEKQLGQQLAILSFYRAWNRCRIEDDLPWLEDLSRCPRDILLTWEPWRLDHDPSHPECQPAFSLRAIASGRYDRYISNFAKALKPFARKIFLRPMHEMNGFWYPWCGTVNSNEPGSYQTAWHHIFKIFQGEGTSVRWVWSPYASSYPDTPANRLEEYYPGDDYVDWLAMDGYNWGTTREWSQWQEFHDLFSPAYASLTALSPHPLMIAETASAEPGGDKARWIREAFHSLHTHFQRVRIVVWFDIDKECDWRITSSRKSLKAFKESMMPKGSRTFLVASTS